MIKLFFHYAFLSYAICIHYLVLGMIRFKDASRTFLKL